MHDQFEFKDSALSGTLIVYTWSIFAQLYLTVEVGFFFQRLVWQISLNYIKGSVLYGLFCLMLQLRKEMPVFWSKNSKKKKSALYLYILLRTGPKIYIARDFNAPLLRAPSRRVLEPQKLLALNQSVIITF